MPSRTTQQYCTLALEHLRSAGFIDAPEAKPARDDLPKRPLIGGGIVLRRGDVLVYHGSTPGFLWPFFIKRGTGPWQRLPGAAVQIVAQLDRVLAS